MGRPRNNTGAGGLRGGARGVARVVVVGASSGGLKALKSLLGALPAGFPLPVLVVAHLLPEARSELAALLDGVGPLRAKEAEEFETPIGGTAYLAPPNYHLQVEPDGRLSLSVDTAVNFARPSVDVLFETAAEAFGAGVVGVVLTGAGQDGARGLARIGERGGVTVVQSPETAEVDAMPRGAIAARPPDHVASLLEIAALLVRLAGEGRERA